MNEYSSICPSYCSTQTNSSSLAWQSLPVAVRACDARSIRSGFKSRLSLKCPSSRGLFIYYWVPWKNDIFFSIMIHISYLCVWKMKILNNLMLSRMFEAISQMPFIYGKITKTCLFLSRWHFRFCLFSCRLSEAGKCFGEIALISEKNIRNATIISDGPTDLMLIRKELYDRTLKVNWDNTLLNSGPAKVWRCEKLLEHIENSKRRNG